MIAVGDYVEHKTKSEEWGIGKVIEKSGTKRDPRVTIFFTKVGGSKTFVTTTPFIVIDESDVSEADIMQLNNISNAKANNSNKYLGIPDAIIGFKKLLETDDFEGERYLKTERDYKVKLHEEAVSYFNKEDLEKLIDAKDYDELMDRLRKFFIAQSNLLSHFEHIKLKDALLESEDHQIAFFNALYDVLYSDDFDVSFKSWISVLDELKQAKWTLATIFLYAIHPDKYMFVKPDTTKVAAEISNFYINYDSKPSLDTYNRVQEFSHYLRVKIKELKPKDMIDIQSFMWYMNPETIKVVTQYKLDNPDYWKE